MKQFIERSLGYTDYKKLLDRLLEQGRTTGPNQSEAMLSYGQLNRQRMRRLEKTVVMDFEIGEVVRRIQRPQVWLVITEGWCGDAAQNIPIIEKIAAASDKIETRYILRDDEPELMARFLTNGARSIPKLIAMDAATFEILGTWGPRPMGASEVFAKMKNSGAEKAAISEAIQRWYNSDKGESLQREFSRLMREWDAPNIAAKVTA